MNMVTIQAGPRMGFIIPSPTPASLRIRIKRIPCQFPGLEAEMDTDCPILWLKTADRDLADSVKSVVLEGVSEPT